MLAAIHSFSAHHHHHCMFGMRSMTLCSEVQFHPIAASPPEQIHAIAEQSITEQVYRHYRALAISCEAGRSGWVACSTYHLHHSTGHQLRASLQLQAKNTIVVLPTGTGAGIGMHFIS